MSGDFGDLLREYRVRLGWTQEDLAKRSGVSAHAISVLESGRRRPRLSSVAGLATALGLDAADRDQLIAATRAEPQRSDDLPAASAADDGEPPARPVPRLLPYAASDFTGRHAEVDRLLALAADRGRASVRAVVISTIDGMAGVGKTALAVQVGHALAADFPDGQLFVDLRGFTPGHKPLDHRDALGRLLRAVGVSDSRLPAGTEERTQLWRSEVADRRILIVLDNAVDAAQVRPLIPGGAGCLVLVTSRRRMPALFGAISLPLDVLGHDQACELFAQIVGPRRVAGHARALDEIVTLCGRLPLAIRIAAARLARRPAWTPVDLLARLQGPQPLLAELSVQDQSVAAAFADSYNALAPEEQRAFRLAALHPGDDFAAHAFAALVDVPLTDAEQFLDVLHDHHLLIEHAPGRYTFHDLLRDFAGQLAAREETASRRRAALVRLFDHYRHSAAAAMDQIAPLEHHHRPRVAPPRSTPLTFADQAEASRWLAAEQPNLLTAAAHAAEADLPVYVVELPAILWRHLKRHMPADEALVLGTRALHAARRLADPAGEAGALRHLGLVHYQLGDFPLALDLLQQALVIHSANDNPTGQAHCLTNLGLVLARMGRLEDALTHHKKALDLSHHILDPAIEAIALINLGPTLTQLGRIPEALDYHQQTYSLHLRTDNRVGQAISLNQLGQLQQKLHRYREAADLHRQSLALFQVEADTFGQSESHMLLGDTFLASDDPAGALGHFEAALANVRYTGERYNLARIHLGLSRTHWRLGRLDLAHEHCREAVDLFTALDLPEAGEARAHLKSLAAARTRP